MLASCLGTFGLVASGAPSAEDLAFFESKIRPALIEHCYECHSEEADKRKGGLWLDRKAGWELGGDSGPAAIPGDVEGSLLIETIRYHDPDLEMPPEGKMPASVIADFEKWVRLGLPDPRTGEAAGSDSGGMSLEEGREFWSFRPLDFEIPGSGKDPAAAAIDRFVGAKLAEAGIEPGPPVDPESRLRRARTDLTGFPPTLEEQDEFLADPSDEKFAEMIDRWLASPEFGERWARHWLDLARYADTSGGGRALTFSEAWRFRDYVIDAWNEDRPLDQLVTAHIAGDLLPHESPEERIENLVATGFLVLGPHNYENQNKDLLELEIADEQMDTLGRAFLGMTLSCARCHDHKFDPVSTRDYYALAGIFLSTNSVTHANVSKWHTEPIPPSEEIRKALAAFEAEDRDFGRRIDEFKAELAKFGVGAGGMERSVRRQSLPGIVIDDVAAEKRGEWMESTSQNRWVDAGYIHDQNTSRGEKAVVFTAGPIEKPGRYELRVAWSAGSNRNPAVPVEVRTKASTETAVVNQKLTPAHDELFHTIGTFALEKGESPVVTVSNDTDRDGVVIADAVQWLPLNGDADSGESSELTREEQERIQLLKRELAAAEKERKALAKAKPKVPEAMCVVDRDKAEIADTPIRIRGVENNHGDTVPRGFLEVVSLPGTTGLEIGPDRSGRLELARWVTHPHNPLTARVLANRAWQHLLGRGIVSSVDNFGVTGQPPTHPGLLDYLAHRLIDSGWSAKTLIREIMLSEAYSRDSEHEDGTAALADPGNGLLWRGHTRAVDVEVMRDTMLHLAGMLDEESAGTSLPEDFKSEFGYEFTTLRRSIYVPVFRNQGFEMFDVFDFANPNFTVGQRSQSAIATQALFLLNSPLVHRHASEAASELLQLPAADDGARIDLAFRRALGRRPSDEERRMALEFLREEGDPEQGDDADAWAALQRALFASLDFRFLR